MFMKLSLIGAGHTLQRFVRNFSKDYEFKASHRDQLRALEDRIEGDLEPFLNSDAMVFSLPPSQAALNLIKHIKFEKKFILLSSIGVYKKDNGELDEEASVGESSRAQLIREIELAAQAKPRGIVFRLGGLFDEDRHPVRSILKRNSTPEALELINFVHTDDVGIALDCILKNDPQKNCYNLVDINHPTKEEYYSQIAKSWGENPINFSRESTLRCQFSSSRFIKEFSTPDNFLNRVR